MMVGPTCAVKTAMNETYVAPAAPACNTTRSCGLSQSFFILSSSSWLACLLAWWVGGCCFWLFWVVFGCFGCFGLFWFVCLFVCLFFLFVFFVCLFVGWLVGWLVCLFLSLFLCLLGVAIGWRIPAIGMTNHIRPLRMRCQFA